MPQRPSEQKRIELLSIAGTRGSPAQPGDDPLAGYVLVIYALREVREIFAHQS
jgi:hypothetical protein